MLAGFVAFGESSRFFDFALRAALRNDRSFLSRTG